MCYWHSKLGFDSGWVKPGAYLGGAIGPWPLPFGLPGSYNCIEYYAKLRRAPPPPPLCKLGIRFDHTKGNVLCVSFTFASTFGRKTGRNLSEDLFFFALHLILGEKRNWFWVEQFLIQIFILLEFSEFPGRPPFSKSCVRYWVKP